MTGFCLVEFVVISIIDVTDTTLCNTYVFQVWLQFVLLLINQYDPSTTPWLFNKIFNHLGPFLRS